MLVIVDANIIVKDPILRDHKWQAAKDAVLADRLRLVLPAVARLEAIGGYRRDHEKKIQSIATVLKKSTTRARKAAEALLQVYNEELVEYESILDSRLLDIGFMIPEPPSHSHIQITERAVNRKPPFDEQGGGYRDTLVWLTALEQVDLAPFENIILISEDGIFERRSKDLDDELHREFGGELTVVRSLSKLEFPGEYEVAAYDLKSVEVNTDQIESAIKKTLLGLNVTRWSPPGPDHAEVRSVERVDLFPDTAVVKKRYGTDVFEVSIEAVADVDAQVLIINDGEGDETNFWEMSARWNLRLLWRGETDAGASDFRDDGLLEVLWLDEIRKAKR